MNSDALSCASLLVPFFAPQLLCPSFSPAPFVLSNRIWDRFGSFSNTQLFEESQKIDFLSAVRFQSGVDLFFSAAFGADGWRGLPLRIGWNMGFQQVPRQLTTRPRRVSKTIDTIGLFMKCFYNVELTITHSQSFESISMVVNTSCKDDRSQLYSCFVPALSRQADDVA